MSSDEEDEEYDDTLEYLKRRLIVEGELEDYLKPGKVQKIPLSRGGHRVKDKNIFGNLEPTEPI